MENIALKRILMRGYADGEQQISELREMIGQYPYFQALRIALLRSLYGTDEFEGELRRNIMYVSDRRNLYAMLYDPERMIKEEEPVAENQESDGESRTVKLIDSFLSCHEKGEVPCEMPGDYTACLLQMEDEDGDAKFERGQELIDNFIENGTGSLRLSSASNAAGGDYSLDEDDIDDACFTETLAKIYIKQQRYDKAVEIIRKLSLKYPKKNVYFANQLKELEKLIINNKIKE